MAAHSGDVAGAALFHQPAAQNIRPFTYKKNRARGITNFLCLFSATGPGKIIYFYLDITMLSVPNDPVINPTHYYHEHI
jgi:hypothetical protein